MIHFSRPPPADEPSLLAMEEDELIDELIHNCDGDPRAAISSLIRIVRSLAAENQAQPDSAYGHASMLVPAGNG